MAGFGLPRSASEALSSVRVYADEDAFQRDERGHPQSGFQFKASHDRLVQRAVDLKLATTLAIIDWKRPPALRDACRVHAHRPGWWPGGASPSNKRDLLVLPLGPVAQAVLGKDWRSIRQLAEEGGRSALWHDDPALVFQASPDVWLGRSACIGHEGLAYYFVYGTREHEWEECLRQEGLTAHAVGAAAYQQHFKVLGQLAGN